MHRSCAFNSSYFRISIRHTTILMIAFGCQKTWRCARDQRTRSKSMANRATLVTVALLVVALVLYHDPFLILWSHDQPVRHSDSLPLDMATDSIDDMYSGCRSAAAARIHEIGVFEWHVNRNFSEAWALAEQKANKPTHKDLEGDHATAIYMHTNDELQDLQHAFNKAVKTKKHMYGTSGFKYHYLYFYLSDAIRVLRTNRTLCTTTYHRSNASFDQNVLANNMRFGSFILTSSSRDLMDYSASVSCFEIYTCFGAEITHYSAIDREGQVLIPPYEVFNVADVRHSGDQRCRVVYTLRSTNTPRSTLNCSLKNMTRTSSRDQNGVSLVITLAGLVLLALSSAVLIRRRQRMFVAVVLGAMLVLMVIVAIWTVSS